MNCRVHGIGVRGFIANLEALPIVVVIRPYPGSSLSNNTFTTLAQVFEQFTQTLAQQYTVAAIGGGESVLKIQHFWNLTSILGDTQWLTDDAYAATVTASPSNLVFLLMAAAVINGSTNFVTGVSISIEVDLDVEFYGRQSIVN
jgi:hypothetical protein